ncbi:hypothetical protein LR48_Vigan03g139100 [Vigna angularis]|uniref:Uncharacterized protein n=1 Tax=Phaseolus angularis TaxID=3914 RepID=A0A0L9U6H5_PHAAN|nr:hypothetical protein LR48_Vigan03g139100 [Vigna angularis]
MFQPNLAHSKTELRFSGYFRPHEGKPALWELDSDYYLHVSGVGDDLIPEKCSEPNPKPSESGGIVFTPIPACRGDFLRIKLTSFDKLIEKTCSTIKNVRLCSEPDQRPGGSSGNSGAAPDAAEIQIKSPNWLFGQRKYEEGSSAAKVASHETDFEGSHANGFCDLNWLSSGSDMNEEDVFQRYLAMTSANEANGWYGGSVLGIQDESSEIYKHYAELCQICTLTGPALELFQNDCKREQHYAEALSTNSYEIVNDTSVVAEMEEALKEYDQVGPRSCKFFGGGPSWLTRCRDDREKVGVREMKEKGLRGMREIAFNLDEAEKKVVEGMSEQQMVDNAMELTCRAAVATWHLAYAFDRGVLRTELKKRAGAELKKDRDRLVVELELLKKEAFNQNNVIASLKTAGKEARAKRDALLTKVAEDKELMEEMGRAIVEEHTRGFKKVLRQVSHLLNVSTEGVEFDTKKDVYQGKLVPLMDIPEGTLLENKPTPTTEVGVDEENVVTTVAYGEVVEEDPTNNDVTGVTLL